ncbi:bifunctional UDP-N-acetylglucosamine diphosphorylase/glucosamine-1-phosphate N-acetyltransferase GlmU [Corynebacterium tapiri]
MKSAKQKTLHSVGGRTMLAHALHAADGAAPEHIVAVVGHQRDQVIPEVEQVSQALSSQVHVAVQEQQNGTGDAVAHGLAPLGDFQGTVVVTNGDSPLIRPETLQALIASHTSDSSAVTVLTMTLEDPTGYGRIVRNESGEVTAIVEQKDASDAERAIREVNSGVFAFDADVLRSALTKLDTDNAQGELYLTDVLGIARSEGLPVRAHITANPEELAGVNNRVQLAEAGKQLNRRLVEAAMLGGATIVDPDSTWIGVDVRIGQDVTIYPGTQLWGETVIEDGAIIGPDTTLTNVTVGEGASVIRTQADDSTIGAQASVGPFTYLRPGTHLGARGKLGGFVESKNATIGDGSKVPHLTYIGDATVGEESNIGASSVFVNYDGVNKHHTTIGSHVRTGSDTMFVAPVTVGDGAYTGAGTVVLDDVPAGALAIKEGRQRVIEGWVEKKRPGSPAAEAAKRARENEGN